MRQIIKKEFIENEEEFLKLLGFYTIFQGEDFCTIVDENHQYAGYIKMDIEDNYPIYTMRINTPFIHMYRERGAREHEIYRFKFEFVRETGDILDVDLDMGYTHPHLFIQSKDYIVKDKTGKECSYINFALDNCKMNLDFVSTTDCMKLQEQMAISCDPKNSQCKKFDYNIWYCDKKEAISLPNNGGNFSIGFTQFNKGDMYKDKKLTENMLLICENDLNEETDKQEVKKSCAYGVSIMDAIGNPSFGMIKNSFDHFRCLANAILPFKEDVLYILLERKRVLIPELEILIPDIALYREENAFGKKM